MRKKEEKPRLALQEKLVIDHGDGDYPKWYAGWDKNEIVTKFEDNKSYLKAFEREIKKP